MLATPAFANPFPTRSCINLDNALEAPIEGEWGYTIERGDIAWIADQGFDTIRLPVRFNAHWDGRVDPAFLTRVDQVIGWILAQDLRVILDLHHFVELLEQPQLHDDTFRAIWTELAQHYAGYDDRLIFELLNEPSGNLDTIGAALLFNSILPTIRETHPNRWIILEGGQYAAIEELAKLPVADPRIALSFHYYSPYPFTHQLAQWHDDPLPAATWGRDAERAALAADFALAAARGTPLLLGEFGVSVGADQKQRNLWTKAVRQQAEAHDIGWCHWGFASAFAVVEDDKRTWRDGMQGALFGR